MFLRHSKTELKKQSKFCSKSIQQSQNLFSLFPLTCFGKKLSACSVKEWPRNHILRRDTAGGGQITIRGTFVQLHSSDGHQKCAIEAYLAVCIISGFSSGERNHRRGIQQFHIWKLHGYCTYPQASYSINDRKHIRKLIEFRVNRWSVSHVFLAAFDL